MQVIIDERVNKEIENYFTYLGYSVVKVKKDNNLYNEISSHTDIFCLKIDDTIVMQKECLDSMVMDKFKVVYGDKVAECHPYVGIYNVCITGNYAVHNFKKTDRVVLDTLNKKGYDLIHVNQEYSRCSILSLGNKSCITSDKGIYNTLIKYVLDVLYIDQSELDIKLLNEDGTYSDMYGFIGGCTSVIGDTVIFFGDINRLKCKDKLVDYINKKGFKIKYFKNMDVIDYGSCIFLD